MTPDNVYPVLTQETDIRKRLHQKAIEGLKSAFPLTVRDNTIHIEDPEVQVKDYGPQDQKNALLQGTTLHEPIKATLVMKDPSGKVIDRVKNFTLMHLPYFTERHSFIVDGNEYQVSNQIRMKPGVFTRRRANDELEAAFNLAKGSNFRLSLDPRKGTPLMEYASTTIPLYPILRQLGIPHGDIAKAWGQGVADANEKEFAKKNDSSVDKLYGKLVHPSKQVATNTADKLTAIRAAYDLTIMDPLVNQATLGHPHEKVTPAAMLDASKKLLAVYKSGDEVDDRDSLAYKTFHSVDDFIKERIHLDARAIAMKVRTRAGNKTTIRELMPPAPFTAGARWVLTQSQLSAIPTQINPMEMIDHAVKVTSLGEGGISSDRAIPMEARQLHPTHFGILDPVRTPESFKAGVDIRVAMSAHRDDKGNLYTPVLNVKTQEFEVLSAKAIAETVVAFPNQELTGIVDVMKKGQVQHVPASEVKYMLYHTSQMYSPASNLIPFMESIQGNRATMGSKMQTQALPLVTREVPLVQVGVHRLGDKATDLRSYEKLFGELILPTAEHSGRIAKIDHQYIYIDPDKKND